MSNGYPINLGLGDIPDPAIDPAVWQELQKISLAAKFIASSIGLTVTAGGVNEVVAADPVAGTVTVQEYAKIRKTAPVDIPAGSVVELEGSAEVYLTSSAHPYPVGFCEDFTPAGQTAELILLGMCHYAPANLTLGAKYYLDLANPGKITTVAGGRFVGQAFASNILWFDPVRS